MAKGIAAFKMKDYETALKEFRTPAEQGEAEAQLSLGVIYEAGYSVSQDFEEAAKWYLAAAEQGNDFAQYNLAVLYRKGQGV